MSAKEVELSGGSPWGFRMHGGVDQNQPLRISRVNPGRKASLSGIREGDVISSINGCSTKGMTNAEAHSMLKTAGPVLKLGLNEDREMSPRRRSIGKSSDLKRPSQIIAEVQKATPQAPVYATIRPAPSPLSRPSSSPLRSSLNSLPTFNSHIKEEPPRFHPTNPFYTTLPHSSASKLPVPNSKGPSLDRNKSNDTIFNDTPELKSPSYFSKYDSGPSSLPYFSANVNGCETQHKSTYENDHSSFIKYFNEQSLPKDTSKNPFEKRNSDPFEKYLKAEKGDSKSMTNSQSENSFHKKEEITRSTVTEHKFSEVEEVKTIKKFVLNGVGELDDELKTISPMKRANNTHDFNSHYNMKESISSRKEHNAPITTENTKTSDYLSSSTYRSFDDKQLTKTNEQKNERFDHYKSKYRNGINETDISKIEKPQPHSSPTRNDIYSKYEYKDDEKFTRTGYQDAKDRNGLSSAEASPSEVVISKPPLKSPPAPAQPSSPNKPVWRPGAPTPPPAPSAPAASPGSGAPPPPPPLPVWTPHSAGPSPQPARKNFRPVHFEESPPAQRKFQNSEQNGCTSGSESESRLRTSHSAPASGLNSLGTFNSRLPKVQNPTVTLLQKSREGQIPRGSNYLQQERDGARLPRDRPSPPKGDPLHALRKEYASEGECEREFERTTYRKMDVKKVDGIGPITKDGMPVALRSEVKDPSRWYKKMYDTIHKNKYDDDYVTIRYKSQRGQQPQRVTNKSQYAYFDPRSGYLSEPEGGSRVTSSWSDYDSDVTSTRRRTASVQGDTRDESPYLPSNKYSTLASARASHEVYKNQPGRIENYVPGKSSVVDKEAKQWWDEVMDIFDGHNLANSTSAPQSSPREKKDLTSTILSKSNMARALKESGYESDSTLIFRRREETEGPLSPAERRAAYKDLQAGGEPPLRGFRSPAPPRQDESEIEYIPITSTLTKIRVHKKSPKYQHEYICYPVTEIDTNRHSKFKKQIPSFISVNIGNPPSPPRRISSRNSRTLKLVTSTRPASCSPKRTVVKTSNVDFLKDRISNKLSRQNTHIISKRNSISETKKTEENKTTKSRVVSTSAPPAVNRRAMSSTKSYIKPGTKTQGTSSFGSPRKTMLPTEYCNTPHNRFSESPGSVVIEGGAGRRTPISNILDKMTSLDKLWSAEKRNERIDLAKAKTKSLAKSNSSSSLKTASYTPLNAKTSAASVSHRGRDMIRMAEKVQKLKVSNVKYQPAASNTKNSSKLLKQSNLKPSPNMLKSSATKNSSNIKVATVTNLKKKKPTESSLIRPRSSPCHDACSTRCKDYAKSPKVPSKSKTTQKRNTNAVDESESGSQFGDVSNETSFFGSHENITKRPISSKDIERTRDAVMSDSFFQHLFLGNTTIPPVFYHTHEPNTTVLQKAKMFQSYPPEHISTNSINSYLIHRKPVSLSRFKIWDRYSSPSHYESPRSISWPGRIHKEIRKFDSLAKSEEFGSNSSIATVRSRSEPPAKMYFSQTSRPKSPTVIFCRKPPEPPIENEHSPSRMFFSQTSRPVSPKIIHKNIKLTQTDRRSKSQSPTRIILTETVRPISPVVQRRRIDSSHRLNPKLFELESKVPKTLFFSQTSRPVSPKVIKYHENTSETKTRSASPISIKSPSYRRIQSARLTCNKIGDTISKGVLRSRSADDTTKKTDNNIQFKTKSELNLCQDPEYNEYVNDMNNIAERSERFRELNRYYSYLERVGELEKATSNCDLRHRRKDEEIIDFDRWKKIRAIERAEEELNNLYHKLKVAQTEKDVLFYPRDVKDFRWNHDTDRGLRIKEKSVEDLKDHFRQISTYGSTEGDNLMAKDTYKPLWRGTSVAETAFNLNKKDDRRSPNRPVVIINENAPMSELRKKLGFGNRLWSSLSMEQVNTLKNQLNAIYSKELESKASKETEMYTFLVPEDKNVQKPALQVRCHSLISPSSPNLLEKELSKSESIAAISYPTTPSVKELKNNVNKIQMTLTENEKRKISQTLSKEVLERMNKVDTSKSLHLAETVDNKNDKPKNSKQIKSFKTAVIKDKEIDHDDKSLNIDLVMEKSDAQQQSSASETETASSDISNRTVIYNGTPPREVKKKVEYFESVSSTTSQPKTIYHARDSSDEKDQHKENAIISETPFPTQKTIEPQTYQIVQSQSCVNFKELFGETERNIFLSLPSKPELCSRSPSPYSKVNVSDRRTPDTLRYSSDETVWRSRSPSPEPERYWRAYIKLARAGEVRRLARRFDSPTAAAAVLRRHRSDPEIARNILNGNTLYDDKLLSRRDKIRSILPVARVPLRPTNRYMPHIDVISKLASLRRRTTPRSRSAEEPSECRFGEVDRMRRRFEAMSILGQIYASAPDVSELQDIAPHLAGTWIAHRFPKQSDNNKSIQDPSSLVRGRIEPVKREVKRVVPKDSVKLSSILKTDTFAKQDFDPSLHRPASRYEPPHPPPRPPPASWPFRLAPFVTPSRHTVTFQESDSAPQPPRRTLGGSYSDTESPRRYVESDVNIHFRCPVRHDPLPVVPERELARQQAEHMKRLYREQRRNKYLQEREIHPDDINAFDASMKELQDMQNRRHQDNFTPSQKNILPLNRYDDAEKVVAKALYAFNGQTAKELSFRKGDVIHVRRQIDANWYEGELHGRIGLFPYNYVEIPKSDGSQSPRKSNVIEGRARAKFDFTAQTNLELPLKKGELVVLTRRIDHNWWEGRHGNKTGIFPDSYVIILQEPSQIRTDTNSIEKPAASPAAHGLVNGSARALSAHSYTPQHNSPALSNAPQPTQPLSGYVAKPVQATLTRSERGYGPPTTPGVDLNNTEPLFVDTNAEAVPYRAMYKYRPQNPDELELNEGDTVYVLEQCDDGWYVGSSQRTGRFGTFPGNYVERI